MPKRIGAYEILSLLGAGGMGEVYRARDTKLGRDVAIKILPRAFTSDPDRLARFEREARMLAALNHPSIGAIYGVEDADGIPALVLELVEGDTLAELIERWPLPLAQALTVARQIAAALDVAHEKGIIHRDLKPANIKITPEGIVKVLDFGLAKAISDEGSNPELAQSSTVTHGGTREGTILGTVAYMSPEQARGKRVDKRTDIWAFGCVLYELLTGRRAFKGATPSDMIASILEREPDWSALPSSTPDGVLRLLRWCLNKDAARRLRDIGDANVALDAAPAAARGRDRMAWSVAAASLLLIVALSIAGVWYVRHSTHETLTTRFEIQTPPTTAADSFALSADGRQLAFVATTEGASRLFVRALDQTAAQGIAGTEGAAYPFWAPNGRAIGFYADGKLKRIDLPGGVPKVLADAPTGLGGAWNRDGVIIFSTSTQNQLFRIPASGGDAVAVTPGYPRPLGHSFPHFLPDGRRFIYYAALGPAEARGIYLGSLDGGTPKRLIPADSEGAYSGGYLLLAEQDVLVARRVDLTSGEVGEPIPIEHAVGSFSVSETGVLAHRARSIDRQQLVWFDRVGARIGTLGSADEAFSQSVALNPALAPDGRRVAFQRSVEGNLDIWMLEADRSAPMRFTFDPSVETMPVWSPDGSRVLFSSNRRGLYDLYEKLANGAGVERLVLASSLSKAPLDWSPDGRFVLYQAYPTYPKSGTDLWAVPLTGDRKPIPVANTPFADRNGQFSPDGHWVAYASNESGRFEVYVLPFPAAGGKWEVSSSGGVTPRWRHDGRELFYIAPDGALMAVPVRASADGQTFEPGAPARLFRAPIYGGGSPSENLRQQYDVARDGQRFLVNVVATNESASAINIVLNWAAGLNK